MVTRPTPVLGLALTSIVCGVWASPVLAARAAPCTAGVLRLNVQPSAGRLAGMSHDGAIVVVRNVGSVTCELAVWPAMSMLDASGAIVAAGTPRAPRFVHPGPVALPIALGAGETAATTVRWITGNVFDAKGEARVAATSLRVMLGGVALTAPLSALAWGPTRATITFEQARLTTALPALGEASSPMAGTFVGEGPAGAIETDDDRRPARTLVVTGSREGALHVSFAGVGGGAPSTGSIEGPLAIRDGRATFDDDASDCHLTLAFYAPQLVVAQRGTCGFGNGVSAAGRYGPSPAP